jgi:trans-2,3-dihydro-3-hydroxyanthranilate isomerase
MPDYRYSLVDVFAAKPLEGNLLPVVEDATGLSTETMATLARRFNLSETSFIQPATSLDATYRHRIFVITGEIPFAGHPSLGTAAVWAYRHGLTSVELVQETTSGLQRLRVEMQGRSGRVTLWQNPPVFGKLVDPAPVLAAIGLPTEAAHPSLHPQAVSTGLPALIVPVADVAWLPQLRLNRSLFPLSFGQDTRTEPVMLYVVAESASGEWQARSYANDETVGEDPATGSAAGAFGAYLQAMTGERAFRLRQGVEMKCPSEIFVDTQEGIAVSGMVHIIGEGTLSLPG